MAKNMIVVKSNELIEASYKITLDEMRILLMTIGKIDPLVENHRRDFEFTVAEFVEQFEIDPKIAYQQIQKAVDTLGSRWAVLADNPKYIHKVIFLTEQIYFKGEGRFQIVLHEKLMPFISNIREKFTKYNLEVIAKFNGFHAIRLYELLAQYRTQGFREMTLEELKNWLQVADKYGDRWNNFKARVLEPTINEINTKSDLFVSYETIKRGRKIHALNFFINHSRQAPQNEQKSTKSDEITPVKVRGKLPQRPQVKAGSHEEGLYFRTCETQIRKGWKAYLALENWRDCLEKLPDSELKLLHKYYKGIGDDLHKRVKKILDKRNEKKP